MKGLLALLMVAAAGCAATGSGPAGQSAADCRVELNRLNAALAAEVAERQRVAQAGRRREEALRRQIEALKAIEHGIVDREERMRTQRR